MNLPLSIQADQYPTDLQPNLHPNLHLEQFLNLSFDLFCVINQNGYFEWLNHSWEKSLGFSLAELLAHPWIELVHPGDRSATLSHVESLFRSAIRNQDNSDDPIRPSPVSFKNHCRCADGSYRCLLWNVTPNPDQERVYVVVRDITETSQLQASQPEPSAPSNQPSDNPPHLNHRPQTNPSFQPNKSPLNNEELFHYLVEHVKDYAIYMLDPTGRIISWNQGAERINGYREDDILGEHVARLYRAEDVASGKPDHELSIAATTGRFEDESWRLRQDGTEFCVHAVITALRDEDGQLLGFAKVVRDVTECHMAEMALQKAYNELEERVEERTEELWRKNEQLERAHEELQQLNAELVAQAQDLGQAMQNLKKTQVQLIQSEKMSSLGQMVAGIAHEINNPVNFIYGNLSYAGQYIDDILRLLKLYQQRHAQTDPVLRAHAESIELDFVTEDLPKLFNSMRMGADRIRQIVLSLRNFSRLDEADKKTVDIHEGIDSTLLILQNRLKARPEHSGITVIKHYADLPLIECYPGQLNQVFMNILTNAIDALEDKIAKDSQQTRQATIEPTIHIFTERIREGWIAIHIADNGTGIPDSVKQRLFDPFFTTKPVGKGTGLGLSISYQIVVEKHGGRLKCLSSMGQGTEFIVEIPLQAS